MSEGSKLIPVILCGGSGTRLWPMSREQMPKQFLKLIGEETLLQATALRAMLVGKVPGDQIVTVTLGSMREEVAAQFNAINPALSQHILCEPMPRNTSAAVAYAAQYIADVFGPDAKMWILAADHHMGDIDQLSSALEYAKQGADQEYLVTFGITPSRPETGYGYIKSSTELNERNLLAVEKFYEKPDRTTAEQFVDLGDFLWNSGMFLFSAGSVLESYETYSPEALAIVRKGMTSSPDCTQMDAEIYSTIAEEPFDKAIMEKSDRVAVVPCDPKWSDIGSWESLWEISEKDENGNSSDGRVCIENSSGCFVRSNNLLIGCAGLSNIIVVETGDAVLIADKSNGDALKKLVTKLRKEKMPEAFQKPKLSANS